MPWPSHTGSCHGSSSPTAVPGLYHVIAKMQSEIVSYTCIVWSRDMDYEQQVRERIDAIELAIAMKI